MIKLIWRNLLRNKVRTFLTLASVGLALFILTFLGAVLDAMESAQGSSDSRVVVRHAVSLTFELPEAYEKRLNTVDHVENVTILNWFGGTYKDQRPENFFPRFGAEPDTLFKVFPEYQVSEEQRKAFEADRSGFIAGKSLAENQGWELGDVITVKGDIYPMDLELTLRGIFEQPDALAQEKQIFFHRRYVEEALDNPGIVGTYWLKLDSPENVPAVVKTVEAMYESSAAPVRAETEEAFALSFLEMMGNIRLLFSSIGLAIVISILFITANTMAMAARDRVREVAVLRTLGFQRGQVTTLVLAESLLVGVLGAVIGAGGASGLIGFAAKAAEDFFPALSAMQPTPGMLGLSMFIGLGIGFVSGIFPAWSAARIDIVDGLRKVA